MALDAALETLAADTRAVEQAIVTLYENIRALKDTGYSYNEIELATGFPRGTIQNIAAGRNPRFSVE